jgi:hypothetical protein
VPIIIFGGVLSISGAALESIGNETVIVGSDLALIGTEPLTTYAIIAPNGPPRLD